MFGLLASNSAETEFNSIVANVLNIVNDYVIRGIIIIGTIVLAVFVLINWIKYGKAEDGEPKTKAKKALIGTAIACVGLFASIWILPLIISLLINLLPKGNIEDPTAFISLFGMIA